MDQDSCDTGILTLPSTKLLAPYRFLTPPLRTVLIPRDVSTRKNPRSSNPRVTPSYPPSSSTVTLQSQQ